MLHSSSLISVTEARELQKNWLESRALDIEKSRGQEDVREFLFRLDDLQNYLNYIKEESLSENPGVRIYLAAYGHENKEEATVFLVPTLGVTLESENDYNLKPLNRVLNGWPPKNY